MKKLPEPIPFNLKLKLINLAELLHKGEICFSKYVRMSNKATRKELAK
jgi:hypothetical protein